MKRIILASLAIGFMGTVQGCLSGPWADNEIIQETVFYQSPDGLKLVGYVFRPDGPGPYPALVWNHGSEQYPDQSMEYPGLAKVFVPEGYVLFAPVRRGHGPSEGPYITHEVLAAPPDLRRETMVEILAGPQLNDQLAGLNYLKTQPYVDTNRIAVMGCSYGGIETMFGAEPPNTGYKVAIALSPGAESWAGNAPLRDRLIEAVSEIQIPVFLIHPAKDASLQPGITLDQEFTAQNKEHLLKIFPATGPDVEQQHCFGGTQGAHVWAPDALQYLRDHGV